MLGCWKYVHSSFRRHTADWFLNAGNLSVLPLLTASKCYLLEILHALPLLNFFAGNPFTASFPSVLVKSDLPSRKFGSLSPHLKNGVNPLSRALFVHYRAILIQIEPLAAFDSQHTNIGILSTLPFRVSKQLISNIGNSSGHPIVPSEPSVSFCRKSVSSSSPEFLAGNPFIASFPSALVKSDLLFWKFGSLSSLTERPSSL